MTTSLRQRLIRYLCEKNKNTETSDELLAVCFHAFESSFERGVPFTLYAPAVNKLILYVYEENCDCSGSPRRLFQDNCRKIITELTEIAAVLIDLAENGYISLEYCGNRHVELPIDHTKNWRRYEGIYSNESDALLYIMSVKITPAEKLYQLKQRRRVVIRSSR